MNSADIVTLKNLLSSLKRDSIESIALAKAIKEMEPIKVEKAIFKTDFYRDLNEENPDLIIKCFEDYSFDEGGVLQIEVHFDNEVNYHSFWIPRIHDFVIKNRTVQTSIGKLTYYEETVDLFKDFDYTDYEQIRVLVQISESLDNGYRKGKVCS